MANGFSAALAGMVAASEVTNAAPAAIASGFMVDFCDIELSIRCCLC
jgi:hypothetical protein